MSFPTANAAVGRSIAIAAFECPRFLVLKLLLPGINPVRMDLIALRQIGHRRLLPQRLQRNLRLQWESPRRQKAGNRRQDRQGCRQAANCGWRIEGHTARQIRPSPSTEASRGIDPDHRCIGAAVWRGQWILGSQSRLLVTERVPALTREQGCRLSTEAILPLNNLASSSRVACATLCSEQKPASFPIFSRTRDISSTLGGSAARLADAIRRVPGHHPTLELLLRAG
jgi:hypothetical protein